jgi:hypothetical protein
MAMIEEIQKGIIAMIEDNYNIVPDTIKIANSDLNKMREELIGTAVICDPETILGMKIIVDEKLNENECIIYNSKCYVEVKNLK